MNLNSMLLKKIGMFRSNNVLFKIIMQLIYLLDTIYQTLSGSPWRHAIVVPGVCNVIHFLGCSYSKFCITALVAPLLTIPMPKHGIFSHTSGMALRTVMLAGRSVDPLWFRLKYLNNYRMISTVVESCTSFMVPRGWILMTLISWLFIQLHHQVNNSV